MLLTIYNANDRKITVHPCDAYRYFQQYCIQQSITVVGDILYGPVIHPLPLLHQIRLNIKAVKSLLIAY